jgi:hypothetical protein
VRSDITTPVPDPAVPTGPRTESELLQRRVDELSQQLLGARDAALGAEAELGVARGRVTELEQQVHVLTVEVAELRAALERGRGRSSIAGVAGADQPARDLARDLARRAGRRLGA